MALGGAASVGILTAIQARINGALGVQLENGVVAGLVSFGSGLLALLVVVPLLPVGRQGLGRLAQGLRSRSIPGWMLVGGACGAFTVTTQGLTAGLLGVSLFTVGVVAGQTVHGLILDRIGIGPAGVVAVTMGRVAGGGLALIAAAISLAGGTLGSAPLWMLAMPFVAGVGIAWQQAANGRLGQRIQSPLVATLVSFFVGTVVLLVVSAVTVVLGGMPRPDGVQPWMILGGVLGAVYILFSVVLVARIGVLLLGLGTVLGQLLTSVVIDALWPAAAGPAPWQLVTMVAVGVAAVIVAAEPWRRRRRR